MAFVPACTAKPPICVNDLENVFNCGTIIVGINVTSVKIVIDTNHECKALGGLQSGDE